jgi:hypothetical protein
MFQLEDITQLGKSSAGVNVYTTVNKAVADILNKFVTFTAGMDVRLGLTVYDFLTSVDFFTAQNGAEIAGGATIDNLTVTGYSYIGSTSALGCVRMYLDATTPIPKMQMEQLTTLPDTWTWIGEWGGS